MSNESDIATLQREVKMLRIAVRLAFRTIALIVRSSPGIKRAADKLIPMPQESEAMRYVNQTSSSS